MLIEALPSSITLVGTELALIVVGYAAEKYYISRLAVFSNATALAIHVLSRGQIGFWEGIYVDIALVLGLIGLVAYQSNTRLPADYYDISLLFYSSITVGLVIALSSYSFFIPLVLGVILHIAVLGIEDNLNDIIHYGEYSGSVKRFHERHTFRIGNQKFEFSDHFR